MNDTAPHPDLQRVRDLPLHKHLGLQVLSARDGTSALELSVSSANVNPMQVLHGGVTYAVCDVAAYVALLTLLDSTQGAVTHDIHISCMRPAPLGSVLRVDAKVVQKGKSLAFVDATATLNGRLIATARVTKSIVAMPAG